MPSYRGKITAPRSADAEMVDVSNEYEFEPIPQDDGLVDVSSEYRDEGGTWEALKRGVSKGMLGLSEMGGTAAQYIGGRIGSETLQKVGQESREHVQQFSERYDPSEKIQGDIVEKPELLKSPEWWAYNIGQTGTSILPGIAAGVISGGIIGPHLKIAGEAFQWSPKLVNALARIGAALPAGMVGGAQEGASTYDEMMKKGADEATAARGAEMMTLASAALNAISFDQMLKTGTGAKGKALLNFLKRGTVAGGTEAFTEYLEEPAEVAIKRTLTPDQFSEEEAKKQLISGVNVMPPSFVIGLLTGGIAGNVRKEGSKSYSDAVQQVTQDGTLEQTTDDQLQNLKDNTEVLKKRRKFDKGLQEASAKVDAEIEKRAAFPPLPQDFFDQMGGFLAAGQDKSGAPFSIEHVKSFRDQYAANPKANPESLKKLDEFIENSEIATIARPDDEPTILMHSLRSDAMQGLPMEDIIARGNEIKGRHPRLADDINKLIIEFQGKKVPGVVEAPVTPAQTEAQAPVIEPTEAEAPPAAPIPPKQEIAPPAPAGEAVAPKAKGFDPDNDRQRSIFVKEILKSEAPEVRALMKQAEETWPGEDPLPVVESQIDYDLQKDPAKWTGTAAGKEILARKGWGESKAPEPERAKEPWEMTQAEFAKEATVSRDASRNYIAVKSPHGGDFIIRSLETEKYADADAIASSHLDYIKTAIKQDKPVPESVLKEYPELAEEEEKPPAKQEALSPSLKSLILHDMRTALEEGHKYGMRDDETAGQGSNVAPIGTTNPSFLMDIIREMKARNKQTVGKSEILAVIRKELEGKGHTLTSKQLKLWFIIEDHLRNESQNPHYMRAEEVMSGAVDTLIADYNEGAAIGQYNDSDLSFPPTEKEIETAAANVVASEVANGREERLQAYQAERGEEGRAENAPTPETPARAEEVTPKTEKTEAGTQAVIPGASEAETFMLTGAPGEIGTAAPKGKAQETATVEEVAGEMEEEKKPTPKPKKPKKEKSPAKAEARQPWEMSLEDFNEKRKEETGYYNLSAERQKYTNSDFSDEHYKAVVQALKEGKKVPHENLPQWAMTAEVAAERSDDTLDETFRNQHKAMVKDAIADGLPVPSAVLADYPELKKGEKAAFEVDDEVEVKTRTGKNEYAWRPGKIADVLNDGKVYEVSVENKARPFQPTTIRINAEDLRAAEKKATTEDVGEELTYNKRNRIKNGIKWSDIEGKNTALKVKETTKQNVYPRPDYEALTEGGMEPMIAHFVKQVYDSISAKPNTPVAPTDEVLKRYIEAVNRVMEGTIKWASNDRAIGEWAKSQLGNARAAMGQTVNISELGKRAAGLLETIYPEGWKAYKEELRIIGGNKVLRALQPGFDEGVRANKAIKEGWPAQQEAWQKQGWKIGEAAKLITIEKGTTYRDGQPAGDHYALVLDNRRWLREKYETKEEAEAAKARHKPWLLYKPGGLVQSQHDTQEEATEAARASVKREAKKDQVSEKGTSVEMAERTGPARRMEGEDISSEKLQQTFGFKGVNFGNWMKGESNAKERQLHLNHAFDSFMDLAEILNVPPKALSLNGMLGLAIGAQGTGKHAAHFVPGVNEINLTRTAGAGAVAHEWGHGLDHYFATQAGLANAGEPFLTEHVGGRKAKEGIRPEIVSAFKTIVDKMRKRDITEEETATRTAEAKEKARGQTKAWIRSIRSDFETQGKVDLEAFDKLADRIMKLDLGDGKISAGGRTYLSPVVAEMRDLYKAAAGRVYDIGNIQALQGNIDHYAYLNSEKYQQREHVPQQTNTKYLNEALHLDKDKAGKKYWSTSLEMFARAFDAYVTDTLKANAAKNTYLSGIEAAPPKGTERTTINAAFHTLISTIQTRSTPQGVEMYEVRDADNFSRQVDEFVSGKMLPGHVLNVSNTPPVLRMLGADQLPMVITQKNAEKILEGKHGLTADMLKQLPAQIADPIMVFESASQPDSLVIMTELKKDGKTVVAAVQLSRKVDRAEVHDIASVHPRESNYHFTNWINQGLLRYQNKQKSREWAVTSGLQLPKVRGPVQGFKNKILFSHDLVKWVNDRQGKESLSVRDLHRRGLLKPAKLEDVKKFFVGQEVGKDANGNIYVKTRGGKYVTLYKVEHIEPNSAVLKVGYNTRKLAPGAVIPGAMGVTNAGEYYIKLHKVYGDVWTLAHEGLGHFLEVSGILNSLDVAALRAHIKRLAREGKFETVNKSDIGGPEDRANFIADRLAVKEQRGPIGRIILRIRSFIDGLLETFGIRNPESILRGIESGRVMERTGREGKGGERYAPAEKGIVDFAQDPEWHDIAYKEPTAESLAKLKKWLKENPYAIVRMYHGTASEHDVKAQGLKRTTRRTAKSLQSRHGVVSLSIFPGMAREFGRMAYQPRTEISVYAVDIPVNRLIPDTDQLKNKRYWGERHDIGGTLADSIAYGHGAQVKGDIQASWIIEKSRGEKTFFSVLTPELPDFMKDYLNQKAGEVEKEYGPFKFDSKSTKNEGWWQLRPADEFKKDSFKRVDSWYGVPLTDGISYVVGTREGYREPQAIRFKADKFTEDQAAAWWDRNKKQFATTNLFRPKAMEMPAFEPGKLNDWLKNETELNLQAMAKREKELAGKTVDRLKPSNLPHNTWLENMLKSFEWMDHPVLSRIVKLMMSTRSELYHENFNHMTDNKVIEATRELRRKGLSPTDRAMGKVSKEYELFGKMVDYLDLYWKRNKKQTREEQLKAQEKWMRDHKATDDIVKVWKLHRETYDKGLDLMSAQMRTMLDEVKKREAEEAPLFQGAKESPTSKLRQTLEYHLAQMDEWKGSYAPRVRTRGSWWVWAHKGEGESKEYVMDFRGSSMSADRLAAKLKSQGWTVSRVEEAKKLPEDIQQQIKTVSVARAIEKALDDMKRNNKGGAHNDLIMKFNEELLENVSDEIKARGFRSSMIHRNTDRVVKGYKEDPLERLVIYTNNTSAGLAKATTAKMAVNELFGEKDEETGERIGGIDPVKEPRVFSTANLYIEEQLRNADQTDRWIGIAKSVATFKYLGFNVRSAFVNTTALATTAPPAIQQYALDGKVGFHKVMNALAAASKDYAKIMAGGKLSDPDEQAFLEDIKKKGYDDPQYTREAMGSIQKTQHRALSMAMDASMYVFGKTEQWNRGTTMLAAYRLARKQGMDHATAEERAKTASDKAHGIYGKATMPAWAMGKNPFAKVGQLMYVYAKFSHNYLQMLYDLGFKKHNLKAFAFATLAPLVVGGMAAFPFKDAIFGMFGFILKALFGEDRDPEKWVWDEIRKNYGSTAEAVGRHGVTGALGLDISSSLSIGVGVPKGLGDLAGPAGGVAEDVAEAWRYGRQGQPWRAAEKIAPRALENPLKALRESQEGATTRHGYRVWDEKGKPFMPSESEAGARAFGFRSTRQAVISERTNEAKREIKSFTDRKAAIYERYRAYLAGKKDPAEHQDIARKVREFNEGLRKAEIPKEEVPRITFESMRRQAERMRKPTKKQKAMLD